MNQNAPTEGMQVGDFVDAYNVRGEHQTIPRHWVDHPVLGKDFTLEPPAGPGAPSMSWDRPALLKHAQDNNVDLSGHGGDKATKPQILAAIHGEPDPAA